MNRSFRAPERPASRGRTMGGVMKDKEEDLALFLEMRKHEKERTALLLHNSSDDLDPPPGSKPGSSPLFKIVSSGPTRKAGVDDFLNSDSDKNDYDWLLTPPGTPLFPSLDTEAHRFPVGNIETPKTRPTVLKSRLANSQDPPSKSTLTSRHSNPSSGLNTSATVTHRPSLSGGPGSTASRPATPTGRPTLPAISKPSRSSTPTSRATVPSKAVVPPRRSSTPSARSSTPTSRPSVPASSRPASRSSTPTRRPSTPSGVPGSSGPPGRSSLVTKSGPMTSKISERVTAMKSSAPPRGASPTVKSRPWKPSDMPGFSLDAPPNLRTSLPDRPSSASRGRPGAPSSRLSSVEAGPTVRLRRQSCSPSRGRAPNGTIHSGSSVPAVSRSHTNGGDNESPVLIGSKMVERVVNVRRLVPPKLEDQRTTNNLRSSSSPDSSGFGRSLSKKSLDMALRHMDIRRSIPNNLRPLMTNIPASSMYSVRSGLTRSRVVSVSDSPLATSSNASSEPSVNNNALFPDGSEVGDDDFTSEKGSRSSPAGPLVR